MIVAKCRWVRRILVSQLPALSAVGDFELVKNLIKVETLRNRFQPFFRICDYMRSHFPIGFCDVFFDVLDEVVDVNVAEKLGCVVFCSYLAHRRLEGATHIFLVHGNN